MGRRAIFSISSLIITLLGSTVLSAQEQRLSQTIKCGSFDDLKNLFENKKTGTVFAKDMGALTPLLLAAKEGRSDMVLYLTLNQKVDLEAVDPDGSNVLHMAAQNGSAGVIQILGEHLKGQAALWGQLVQAKDDLGLTPLHWAAQRGDVKSLNVLFRYGSNPNVQDSHGKTPLYWAIKKGHKKAFQRLLSLKSVSINDQDAWGMTLLHVAAQAGVQSLVQDLIQSGASVNVRDVDGKTPLYRAASRNHLGTVKVLLSKGADAGIKDLDQRTALHKAARYGHTEVVEFLVNDGRMDPNEVDALKETPLCWAVRNGHVKTAKALLVSGADLKYLIQGKGALVHEVVKKGYAPMLQMLAGQGYDVGASGSGGKTLLHTAAMAGKVSMISLLISQGADPSQKDSSGKTPLHYAAAAGNVGVAQALLRRGPQDILLKDQKDGKSPLDHAVSNKQLELVETLLYGSIKTKDDLKKASTQASIDFFQRDSSGKTILEYGLKKGHIKLLSFMMTQEDMEKSLKILKKSDGDLNSLDADTGMALMHYGVLMGNKVFVSALIQAGVEVDVEKGNFGMTPLHYAVLEKSASLVTLLMKNGADAVHADKDGKTPFMGAIHQGFGEGVSIFLRYKVNPMDYVGDVRPMESVVANQNTQMIEIFMDYFKGELKMLDRFDRVSIMQNMKDDNGMTVMHWASKKGHSGLVDTLFDSSKIAIRPNFSDVDKRGRTPLHYAAAGGYSDIIEKLMSQKDGSLNINALNEDRLSALHEAAKNNQLPAVKKLIDLGADRTLLDKDKKKALDYLGKIGQKIEDDLSKV